jgi:oxalate decarboxylase/phosphoglucose isomerase-like protein (cupin superfamily)
MSLFHDERFIFGADYVFDKRFKGEKDYFERPGKYLGSRLTEVNFIRDVSNLDLYNWDMRGKGARTTFLSLSDSTLAAHISSFEVGTYKKGHRHGAGAHVIMLDGEGYSLFWKDGHERQRVEWGEGTMFAPPEWWWHQHFNTGSKPARYLAIRNNNPVHPMRIGMASLDSNSQEFGPSQIEYEDEDPIIYEDYDTALIKAGIGIRQAKPK